MADQHDFVVHALQGNIGDPAMRPGQDALELSPDQVNEVIDRPKPAVARPPEPLHEIFLRPARRHIVQEVLDCLLEQITPEESEIELRHPVKPGLLRWSKVQGIPHEDVASIFHLNPFPYPTPQQLFPAKLICRAVEIIDDTESVEQYLSSLKVRPDRLQKRLPHVPTHRPDRPCFPHSQPPEELVEGFLSPVLTDPDQMSPLKIVDQGEIFVSLLPADFVNPDDGQ